jgi:hypothetical protein
MKDPNKTYFRDKKTGKLVGVKWKDLGNARRNYALDPTFETWLFQKGGWREWNFPSMSTEDKRAFDAWLSSTLRRVKRPAKSFMRLLTRPGSTERK